MTRLKVITDFLDKMEDQYNPKLKFHAQMTATLEGLDHPNVTDDKVDHFLDWAEKSYKEHAERSAYSGAIAYHEKQANETQDPVEQAVHEAELEDKVNGFNRSVERGANRDAEEMDMLAEESSRKPYGTVEDAWDRFNKGYARVQARSADLLDEWEGDKKDGG